MPNFKFVISSGKQSYQVEKDQKDCPVLGRKISETIDGDFLGLSGYELMITGGSDKDGFPMIKDVEGMVKKRIILSKGIGLRAEKGFKKRKMIRGNTIGADIVQINCNVTKNGPEPLEKLLGKKEEAKEEVKEKPEKKEEVKEKPKEEKEEVKQEQKPEAPEEKKPEAKEEVKEKPKQEAKEEAKPEAKPEEKVKKEEAKPQPS